MLNDIDFRGAYIKANELLVRAGVAKFPFDIIAFIKQQPNCVCRTFKKAHDYGIDIEAFGSDSAVLIQMNGKSIIFVDEQKPVCHTNYSVAHELGHLACKHELYHPNMSQEKYRRYEIEANYFAAQALMPDQLIRELQHRGMRITVKTLQDYFGVSEIAASKRIDTLHHTAGFYQDLSERMYDDIILSQCNQMLEAIRPRVNLFNYEQEYEQQQLRDSWL